MTRSTPRFGRHEAAMSTQAVALASIVWVQVGMRGGARPEARAWLQERGALRQMRRIVARGYEDAEQAEEILRLCGE
jgi:hypothetical protein